MCSAPAMCRAAMSCYVQIEAHGMEALIRVWTLFDTQHFLHAHELCFFETVTGLQVVRKKSAHIDVLI